MSAVILFVGIFVWSVSAYAIDFAVRSKQAIVGRAHDLGLDFSAVSIDTGSVVVEIQLHGKRVMARINYEETYVQIHSLSLDQRTPVTIDRQDIDTVVLLMRSLALESSQVADALMSTLNFVSEVPPGIILQIDTKPQQAESPIRPQQDLTSLCDRIGQRVTATYDILFWPIQREVVVGPCASDTCLGRCGAGCAFNPLNPSAVQRFTQGCLDHDVCTREAGIDPIGSLPPCADEFAAASEDYFFAPDCMKMTGTWIDNYRSVWTLTESTGSLSGNVQVENQPVDCGTWHVTGARQDFDVILTATIPLPVEGCCRAFTYTGTTLCIAASGTWTDACQAQGAWSMSKSLSTPPSVTHPMGSTVTPASNW
jgi:hypothetical protein